MTPAEFMLLADRLAAGSTEAAAQLLECKKIAEVFRSADPAAVGVGIREYARNVLKINVSN